MRNVSQRTFFDEILKERKKIKKIEFICEFWMNKINI